MTDKSTADENPIKPQVNINPGIPRQRAQEDLELMADPAYQELLVRYQNAEWDQCGRLIDNLLIRYPGKQILVEFRADIDMQLMLNKMSVEKARNRKVKSLYSVLAVLGLLAVIVLVITYFVNRSLKSYQQQLTTYQVQLEQAQAENISLLENQARSSLQSGKPDVALDILTQMEELDPDYPSLESLRSEAIAQQELVNSYEEAMGKMALEQYDDALVIFRQIRTVDPLFRDVGYQIIWIENHKKVLDLISAGQAAYMEKSWQDAIGAYEEALALDSTVNTPEIKDQMLYSYLNSIVETLSKDDHTIDELERSGVYYRKAIALIPQDRNYIAERERLQSLSLELLVSKNYQMAKNLLSDPNHTRLSVTKAINFLKYASELKPDEQVYKTELSKAELYFSALQYFDQGKMLQAANVLEDLAKFDRTYPNGMGPTLLYEAYVSRGLQLHKDGFYLDARASFEDAELIAWEQMDNKIQLFLVQINLGNTIGKLENYQDAVSYFEYALKAIEDVVNTVDDPDFTRALSAGREYAQTGQYYEAYFAYLEALEKMDLLFTYEDINVYSGDTLIYLARQHHSTIQAIQMYNAVEFPLITRNQVLRIPYLP